MDPSGIWGQNGLPFLDLSFDGLQDISGTTYWHARQRSTRAAIQTGSFNPRTNVLRLEGDAPSLDGEGESSYFIEATLSDDTLIGTYDCGGVKGSFTFTKLASRTG